MVNCPWSPHASCNTEIFSDVNSAFIIGSNSPDRREYIDMIKDVIKEFNLEPRFALDLNQYNGKQAFCTNICSQIRKSRIVITDLSGPTEIVCNKCKETKELFSVNVFWEYGYAAALEKDPILICDESQYVPFDVADKNAEFYNKGNLKELLRPVIQQRLNVSIPLSINKEKKIILNQNTNNYQAKAQEILFKVNNKEISISVILPEYYEFLREINEKKEEQWVGAELSGNVSELGKDHPEYFEYRKIKGYISPSELISAGMYSLDIIAADEKSMMFKHDYIPSISIHEIETFLDSSTGFGRIALSKKYIDSIGVDLPRITKFYFYFNPTGLIRIITNIRSKIGAFLVQYIRK
ncbi:hypothetical protein LCGC14_2963770 [marine sediment metagenome]|uniref:CD-NTase-associated protein 12/Pycsar effector protein TIR domain-containing protein n=1 Tax=marine sediment metagenome TaxID=412755 RepID=A0A0F8XYW5_9ZZZZ